MIGRAGRVRIRGGELESIAVVKDGNTTPRTRGRRGIFFIFYSLVHRYRARSVIYFRTALGESSKLLFEDKRRDNISSRPDTAVRIQPP